MVTVPKKPCEERFGDGKPVLAESGKFVKVVGLMMGAGEPSVDIDTILAGSLADVRTSSSRGSTLALTAKASRKDAKIVDMVVYDSGSGRLELWWIEC
jgi:hypothetical protein